MKSAVLLAGLFAEGGETTVVEPLPTRDHTERLLEHAGAPITRRPADVRSRAPERLSLGEIEIPGDFSSAAPSARRRGDRPRLGGHGPRGRPEPAPNRAARRPRAHGRARRRLQPALDRRRARRGRRGAAPPSSSGRRSRPAEVPVARRRASALRARGVSRARRDASCAARRSCASRRRIGSRRSSRSSAASAGTFARPRRVPGPGSADARFAAASSTRAATIASRCSARSPASPRARASSVHGAEAVETSFPGFFDVLDAAEAPPARCITLPRHDRGDRRAGRLREEHRRVDARAAARLPLPRHGRDVSRAHMARASRRSRRSTTAQRSPSSRARTRSRSATADTVEIDGEDVTTRSASRRSTDSCPSSRAIRRCAR